MSMYDAVFQPQPERIAAVLTILGFKHATDVGRLRDAWVEKQDGEVVLAVYTRNGGNNREDQAEGIERMQQHPLYLRDADDQFDNTYATFYFRVPELGLDPAEVQEHIDTDKRWLDAIDAMKQQS